MTQRPIDISLADLSSEQLHELAAGTFTDVIGLVVTELTPERATGELDVSRRHHQPFGLTHGGVYCTVVETLASLAGGAWYGRRGTVVGVHNSTNFLRSVREGRLHAEATPLHRGGLQQLWQVVITDDQERTVAQGQVRLQNLPVKDS